MTDFFGAEVKAADGFDSVELYEASSPRWGATAPEVTVSITADGPADDGDYNIERTVWTELDLDGAVRLRDALNQWIESQPKRARND